MVDLEELTVADAAAWRHWLASRPAVGPPDKPDPGVWLVLAKKGTTEPTSLTYAQAVDEALCFGWIDGQSKSRDEFVYIERFTPRRSRSPWSKRNVELVARLIAEGRMTDAGLAEIERAKADGRWDAAYAGPATIEMAEDLSAALKQDAAASAMFEILSSQNRYAILYRLDTAKRAETRARRLEEYVAMLARGETLYPQKQRLELGRE